MAFEKHALVLPAKTVFEERTIVTNGDFILGNHVKTEFGVHTDGRLFTGQGVEIQGDATCDDDLRLDQSTHVLGDVSTKANAYVGERCFIQGDLALDGDLDVGDDVRIGGALKATGWVNKRNPVPAVIYILLYMLELLRLGKSEEVDRILEEMEAGDDVEIAVDKVFLFVPDGSHLGLQQSDIKGGMDIGTDCRILGNFRAKGNVKVGDNTTMYGALRVEGNVELRPDCEIQGSLEASGHVIIGEGCQVLGDLKADSVEMYTSATVDGKILAENGITFRTEAQDRAQEVAEEKVEEYEGKAADLVDLLG